MGVDRARFIICLWLLVGTLMSQGTMFILGYLMFHKQKVPRWYMPALALSGLGAFVLACFSVYYGMRRAVGQ